MQVPIVLKRAGPPLNRQIYDQWRGHILAGRFRGGHRVPATRELAQVLNVSRTTVTTAYAQLIAKGYCETSHGSGTFVSGELPDDLLHGHRVPSAAARPAPPVR